MVCVRPCRYRGNFDGSMEWTAQLSSQMVALLVLQASSWNHHWRRGPGTCGAGAVPPPPPCAADPAFTLLTPPSTMGSAPSHLDLPAKFGIPLNTRVPCSRAEVKVSWLPWVGCVLTRCLRTWWDDLQRNMVALAAEAKQKRGQYWNDVAFISADSTTYTSQHMIVWHDGSPPQGTAARPIDIVHFDGVARVIDSPPMQGSAARPIDMAHIDAWGNATGRLTHQRMHRKMHELRNQFQTWLNANPGAEVVDLVRFLEPNQSRHCPWHTLPKSARDFRRTVHCTSLSGPLCQFSTSTLVIVVFALDVRAPGRSSWEASRADRRVHAPTGCAGATNSSGLEGIHIPRHPPHLRRVSPGQRRQRRKPAGEFRPKSTTGTV